MNYVYIALALIYSLCINNLVFILYLAIPMQNFTHNFPYEHIPEMSIACGQLCEANSINVRNSVSSLSFIALNWNNSPHIVNENINKYIIKLYLSTQLLC